MRATGRGYARWTPCWGPCIHTQLQIGQISAFLLLKAQAWQGTAEHAVLCMLSMHLHHMPLPGGSIAGAACQNRLE